MVIFHRYVAVYQRVTHGIEYSPAIKKAFFATFDEPDDSRVPVFHPRRLANRGLHQDDFIRLRDLVGRHSKSHARGRRRVEDGVILALEAEVDRENPQGWCPPVISWFINPINYSYTYHKP